MTTLSTPSVDDQIAERGGVKFGDVIAFSVENLKIADLSESHRDHSGSQRQCFSLHDESVGVTYHAAHSQESLGGFQPRHRHPMDQIRFILTGEMKYGRKGYGPGWLGFFPESVFYGPHEWTEPGSFIVVQCPGPSNARFPSFDQAREAARKIRESGGVLTEDGFCLWPDGTKQDGAEAMEQTVFGSATPYAPPRFEQPIWMQTENIPWAPTAIAGVSVKRLGFYSEHGPAIELIQLAPGASLSAGKTDRLVTRYIYEGTAEYESLPLPSDPGRVTSNLAYMPGAEYAGLSSKDGAKILSVEMNVPLGSVPYLV